MKKTFLFIMFFMVITGIFLSKNGAAAAEDMFKITLIDVGKGDCILVQTGPEENPVNVMIDTGYQETASDVLKFLEEHGVTKLDALIISHFHKDHVGGAAEILEKFQVDHVYMPDYDGTRKVYENMMNVLARGTIPYERLTENKSISFGDAVYNLYPSTIEFDGDPWPPHWNIRDIRLCSRVIWKMTVSNNF